MPRPALRTWLSRPVATDAAIARLVQAACFLAAPALMIAGVSASARLGTTPGAILLGVLASGAVALLLVILGVVLPLAVTRPTTDAPHA